jgi:CDP-glucose 4,6-dehydratase
MKFYGITSSIRHYMKSKSFWKNKRVLITGFEGFLGSNLTRALVPLGAEIYGLDVKVKRKETILNSDDYKKIVVIKGSVTNYKLVRKIIRENKINIVFHLAAEAIVLRGYSNPLRNFSTNIEGTWKVLEACRNSQSINAIIIASSDKAYGSHKKLPYKEDTPLIGRNPYDVSKSCADLISHSYAHTYNLPIVITRCGNIYGPGDFNFSRLIPDAIRCALNGKTLLIRSDGKFTRDYVHVDDIVNGYIMLAEKLQSLKFSGEAFNFSDENPITVLSLVKKIYNLTGNKDKYRILNNAKYEIKHQYLAYIKARRILGWKPKVDFKNGMNKTITWYKKTLIKK